MLYLGPQPQLYERGLKRPFLLKNLVQKLCAGLQKPVLQLWQGS